MGSIKNSYNQPLQPTATADWLRSAKLKMQPYNSQGKKLRFALMSISYVIAAAIVYFLLVVLAKINGSTIKVLLRTDNFWPLAVILPCFAFGKILGLMTMNIIAFKTPPLRHIFEKEVAETSRHNFEHAMKELSIALAVLGAVTLLGVILFLQFK